jgi:hypothetical protein
MAAWFGYRHLTAQWGRILPAILGIFVLGVAAIPAHAVPQFARRYNLKCSACHTIAPNLNEQGYLFKRLGYHLPPALTKGQPGPEISYIVRSEPKWDLLNNLSVAVSDFSFQTDRSTATGSASSSTSAFQVNSWNSYAAGWIPDTNFFYFSEFDIVTNGVTSPDLMNAYFGYSGGNARSSWYLAGGREHLQVGEGTRAAQIYSFLPASPLLFENASPTNFMLDQAPVGIDAGYTWASDGYKHVFAATAKITNGDNADGSEILGSSSKNSKDLWFDMDYWYAPESGVTFLDYYGSKDQIQNSGLSTQFTYRPAIRRQGLFANYMLPNNKADFLGGYLRSKDDWQETSGVGDGYFKANDFYGEADYYIQPGLVAAARYDLLHQTIPDGPGREVIHDWTAAVNRNLTPSGNIVGRMAYSYSSGSDPSSAVKSTSSQFQADIMFNF